MFEVVVTFRPNFVEEVVSRHATEDEAQAAAQRILAKPAAEVVRVWVCRARKAETTS